MQPHKIKLSHGETTFDGSFPWFSERTLKTKGIRLPPRSILSFKQTVFSMSMNVFPNPTLSYVARLFAFARVTDLILKHYNFVKYFDGKGIGHA